jgi:putative membrane protein
MLYGLGRMGYRGAMAMPWLSWVAPIAMLVFWVLVVVAIAFLIRFLVRGSRSATRADSAVEILKARYARGEISKAEFDEKRRDLQ